MNRHLDEIISLRMISFFQMLLNFAKSFSSIQFEVRTLELVKFAPNFPRNILTILANIC